MPRSVTSDGRWFVSDLTSVIYTVAHVRCGLQAAVLFHPTGNVRVASYLTTSWIKLPPPPQKKCNAITHPMIRNVKLRQC